MTAARKNCRIVPVPPPLRVIPAPTVYKLDSIILAMRKRFEVTIAGHTGLVNGIQAEDGSGKSWLIKFHNRDKWVYVRAV